MHGNGLMIQDAQVMKMLHRFFAVSFFNGFNFVEMLQKVDEV